MTKKHPLLQSLPERKDTYEQAYEIALGLFTGIKDYKEQCRKSGARYVPAEKAILIEHLNRTYRISVPDGEISLEKSTEDVPVRDRILILHYFQRAAGTPLAGLE